MPKFHPNNSLWTGLSGSSSIFAVSPSDMMINSGRISLLPNRMAKRDPI